MKAHRALAVLFAFPLALALAPDARADDPKLDVQLAPKKAQVTVGEDIELEVSVKNVGTVGAEVLELVFDKQSVSFEIAIGGGRTFRDMQMHDSVFEPKKYEKKALKPGEEMKKTFTVPSVAAGEWEISAIYAGGFSTGSTPPKELGSEPKKVKVVATKDGSTELGVKMRTNMGPMTIKFFPNEALCHVLSFIRLSKDGFYDNKTFHRIVNQPSMGVVQGGDPKGNGQGGPGFNIPAEFNDQKHTTGRLSMARRGDSVDSAGSQFFMCTRECPHLDHNYTVFGEVVKGLDVLSAMGAVKCNGETPADKLVMESVRVEPLPKE